MQSFLKNCSSVAPRDSEMVHTGKPWGGLQQMLTGKRLAKGLHFRVPKPGEGRIRFASRRTLPIPVKVRDHKVMCKAPSPLRVWPS